MGFFDSLGNFASRVGREALKGVGAVGEFAGNIAGGAWQSFTEPGFNLPATGGIAGTIGGLVGELGEATLGQIFQPSTPEGGRQRTGYPQGINPDPRAQRDLEIFLGQTGGYAPTYGTPQAAGLYPGMQTTEFDPGRGMPGLLPGTEAQYPMMTNVALPGGALLGQVLRQIPGVIGGTALGLQYGGNGGGAVAEAPFGGTIFRQTPAGLRARSLVEVVNPYTGKKSWYRNVGRPILFSGDLRACRRVRKIAGRARRARGR